VRRNILNMEYNIASYGKIVKIETRLCYKGSCASVNGKLDAQDMMDSRDGEVRLEGLAQMDQYTREEQVRLWTMKGI
jgi:hypothetical protein